MSITSSGKFVRVHHPAVGRRRGGASALAALLLMSGCAIGSSAEDAAVAAARQDPGTRVPFDAADFVDPALSTNPYHPLKPGTQWVYTGSTEVGSRTVPHGIVVTITDVIREINGVPTVAMLGESTDSGEISQTGMDYMALDKDGNVWILGGYDEDFEGGEYTNIDVSWLGSGEGQLVGILSPKEVTMTTPGWFIGAAPEEDGSIGQPVQVGVKTCVSFGCFENVRVVREGNIGAPDNENKYYAPGVGVIKNVPLDASLHQDRFELVNFLTLSAEGLAAASRSVLAIEAHARETSPEVFGPAPVAKRKS